MEGYDKSGRFLDAYRFGNQHLAPNSATRSVKLDINKFDPRKVSLEGPGVKILLLGYVWNEIGDNPRLRRKIEQLCVQTLSEKKGLVMILEPANQQPARALVGAHADRGTCHFKALLTEKRCIGLWQWRVIKTGPAMPVAGTLYRKFPTDDQAG